MPRDRYLKIILTVIAIELGWLGVKDMAVPVSAQQNQQASRPTTDAGGHPRHRPSLRRLTHINCRETSLPVSVTRDDRADAGDGGYAASGRCARHRQDPSGSGDHRRDRRSAVADPVGAADRCAATGDSRRQIASLGSDRRSKVDDDTDAAARAKAAAAELRRGEICPHALTRFSGTGRRTLANLG